MRAYAPEQDPQFRETEVITPQIAFGLHKGFTMRDAEDRAEKARKALARIVSDHAKHY